MELIDTSNMSPLAIIVMRLYSLTQALLRLFLQMLFIGISLPEIFR